MSINSVPKRVFDIVVCMVLLIPIGLLVVGLVVLVRATSPGAAIYRQRRAGWHGKVFTIYKIRTMRTQFGSTFARCTSSHDPRVTRVGRHLRKYHLDELPQLFNVLMGHMSIVGPRPHELSMHEALARSLPGYSQRLCVKPGLTGPAKLAAEGHLKRELCHDLIYARRPFSMRRDTRYLVATAYRTLRQSARQ